KIRTTECLGTSPRRISLATC
ncbi:hypothetical protein AB1N83_011980, partial [Pleurotus pulmonarius]